MDKDVTWYGGRHRPMPDCVTWRPMHGMQLPLSPQMGSMSMSPNGRPSQELLSSCYFASWSYCEFVMSMSVCVSVRLSARIFPKPYARAIFAKFLCIMPMSVARSSSGKLMIGRIACRLEGGDRSAQWRGEV